MAAVKRIEETGAGDQAGRVLQRVKSIYRWAANHERIDANPMIDLVPSEVLKPRDVTHRPAMSDGELPGFPASWPSWKAIRAMCTLCGLCAF